MSDDCGGGDVGWRRVGGGGWPGGVQYLPGGMTHRTPCKLRQAESGFVEILDTFDFLLGTWNLDRSIEDHRSQTCGSFHGTAAVVVVAASKSNPLWDGRARYDETGELCFGTHTGPASRRLEYMTRQGSEVVMIYFADGRPFIDLDLRSGMWRGIHHCGDDRYELTTIARSHRVMEEHWRVRGPNKSYDAVTTLVRADG